MQPETTSDSFKPISYDDMYLFLMNRMPGFHPSLGMTAMETEEGVDVLMVIETDDDKN